VLAVDRHLPKARLRRADDRASGSADQALRASLLLGVALRPHSRRDVHLPSLRQPQMRSAEPPLPWNAER